MFRKLASGIPAASSPVPDHGSMDGEQAHDDEGRPGGAAADDDDDDDLDPWAQALGGNRPNRQPDPEEFQRFREFMQNRGPSRSWRTRRGSEDHDDKDDEGGKGAGAGPPPRLADQCC